MNLTNLLNLKCLSDGQQWPVGYNEYRWNVLVGLSNRRLHCIDWVVNEEHPKMWCADLFVDFFLWFGTMRRSREGGGWRRESRAPELSQKYNFFVEILVRIPWNTKPTFNAFRWRADNGPPLLVFWSSLPLSTKKQCQSWIPSDKTFWIRTWALSCIDMLKGLQLILNVLPWLRIYSCYFDNMVSQIYPPELN